MFRWEAGGPKVVTGETRLQDWEYQTGAAEEGPYQMVAAGEACLSDRTQAWEHQNLVAEGYLNDVP